MRILLSLLSTIAITGTAVSTVTAADPYKKQEQAKLESSEINNLETNNQNLKRMKRNVIKLPNNAHKIIIHNMRGFDVYGSSDGAYIARHGNNNAQKVLGINGNVIHGIITDKYFQEKYNIYLTVKDDDCTYQYYTLKDGETIAHKINGLPDDAKLLAIHNLAGVIFFGSVNGAYELTQGDLIAYKVSHANGNVVEIRLRGGPGKYDADFITITDEVSNCKYKLEMKKLQDELNKVNNELFNCQEDLHKLKLSIAHAIGFEPN